MRSANGAEHQRVLQTSHITFVLKRKMVYDVKIIFDKTSDRGYTVFQLVESESENKKGIEIGTIHLQNNGKWAISIPSLRKTTILCDSEEDAQSQFKYQLYQYAKHLMDSTNERWFHDPDYDD